MQREEKHHARGGVDSHLSPRSLLLRYTRPTDEPAHGWQIRVRREKVVHDSPDEWHQLANDRTQCWDGPQPMAYQFHREAVHSQVEHLTDSVHITILERV